MAQMSVQAVYNLTDAFWLGKLSPLAITAPGVSMPFVFIVFALAAGFGNGGAALVAQYAGAGRHGDADRAAGQTLIFLLAVSLVFAGTILCLTRPLLALVRVPENVAAVTNGYLRIFILGTPFVACTVAYGSALRALGDTLTVVYIGAASSLLNLVLDPILIFYLGMGVNGAAVASVAAQFCAATACMVLLHRGRSGLKLRAADLRPDLPMLSQIVSVGLPAGISMSSNSVGFTVFQALINNLGKSVIAAFTIGFRMTHFLSIPGHCMAMAAAPLVGQALGAAKPERARHAVRLSVVLVAAGTLVPYAIMMWQGRLITRFFVDDPAVTREAVRFFLIVPASNYFFTVMMVLSAAFYGSGHTRPVMVVSLLRQWALRIGWGSLGIYTGMGLANILCAVLMLWIFLRGNWTRAVIPASIEEEAEIQAEAEIEALDVAGSD
jgi:putative MATE family efflux protein